ncbi:hypothetical protein FBU30_003855 [Linnemannia zychae]|nr:hypothetical protein FBU30_003855 [Linnemannia zychae]
MFVPMSAYPRTTPPHPALLELQFQQDKGVHYLSIYKGVLDICVNCRDELSRHDFLFILEVILDYSTSRQQFWESITILSRSSMACLGKVGGEDLQLWEKAISSAILGVYPRSPNMKTLMKHFKQLTQDPLMRGTNSKDKRTDVEVLASTILDGLLLKASTKRAMDLYVELEKHNVSLPNRYLSRFIRIAVSQLNRDLLEQIGNLLLDNERFFQAFRSSDILNLESRTRPIHLSTKIMDSFIYGACKSELYELARAVFDHTLESDQKYRVSTFNNILNSYSVKSFGFDIVEAAELEKKRAKRLRNSYRCIPDEKQPSERNGLESVGKITVAEPGDIAKYMSTMKYQGVVPNIVTLNILVKLYLEMNRYKVPKAPYWKAAFWAYNPSKLQPDLVTNNTLLAYYEKQGDLETMKRIYDSMANAPTSSRLSGRERKSEPKTAQEMTEKEQYQDMDMQECQQQHQPVETSQSTQSSRDIYTYNTMLHALLQHAVESKDFTPIEQCFRDMANDGISADTVTFNTNILYHIAGGNLPSATQVFHKMERSARKQDRSKFKENSRAHSLPVKSLSTHIALSNRPTDSNSHQVTPTYASDDASPSDSDVESPPVPAPDIVTLTSLISGFGLANQMDKAAQYFNKMTNYYNIKPNLKTYSTIVAGLHRAGEHQKAEMVWNAVLEEEKSPAKETQQRHKPSKTAPIHSDSNNNDNNDDDDDAEKETTHALTVMERKQAEALRKLYNNPLYR